MKLTKENYFSLDASREYFSVSQYKTFVDCEAKAKAEIDGLFTRKQSEDQLVGSMVHAANEGTLDEFRKNNTSLYCKQKGKEGQLLSKFKNAEITIDYMMSNKLIQRALAGEKEQLFTAEMFGVKWKILIDSYNPSIGIFTDLKIMANYYDTFWNAEFQTKFNLMQHYGYLLQMAVYAEVERLANNRDTYLQPHVVIITKQTPPDSIILKDLLVAQSELLFEIESNMPRFLAVKNGEEKPRMCNRCEYCRSVKNTLIMPYDDFANMVKKG